MRIRLRYIADWSVWHLKERKLRSGDPVVFTSFFHEKGGTRFVQNFSPSHQRHFLENWKNHTPTLLRISSLSSLDRFRPQSFIFHTHNSIIQLYTAQQCTLKNVVKYYNEKSTHPSNKPNTLSRFLTFASCFHVKVRVNKESVTKPHRGYLAVLAYNCTSNTSIWTYYAFGVPRGAVPYILDVTVVL
jgi:hypothetical protein